MSCDFQTAVSFLLEQGYMVKVKDKYKVTAKFNQAVSGKEVGLMIVGGKPMVAESAVPAKKKGPVDWTHQYLQFIQDAQIPARGQGKNNGYDLNKFSLDGMNAFRRAIQKENVVYAVLVKSTMLYYKTRKTFPLAIGTYMSQGAWRTDYLALMDSHNNGELENHIQKEIDNGTEFSHFKIG